MFHAVAFSFKDQQVSVVDKAVDHCCRHLVIGKDTTPFGKLQVRSQDQTDVVSF